MRRGNNAKEFLHIPISVENSLRRKFWQSGYAMLRFIRDLAQVEGFCQIRDQPTAANGLTNEDGDTSHFVALVEYVILVPLASVCSW